MTPRDIQTARCPDLRASWPALLRAAQRAREVAAQTGTAIVIRRNGVIEYVYPQQEAVESQVQERTTPDGGKS